MQLTPAILEEQTLNIKIQYRLYMAQSSLQEVKECIEEAQEMAKDQNDIYYKLRASVVLIEDLLAQIGEVIK